MARLEKLVKDRDITVVLTPKAREWLAAEGYDPAYGARPPKRVNQREVQGKLAEQILAGTIVDGQTVQVDAGDGGLLLFPEADTVTEAAA